MAVGAINVSPISLQRLELQPSHKFGAGEENSNNRDDMLC